MNRHRGASFIAHRNQHAPNDDLLDVARFRSLRTDLPSDWQADVPLQVRDPIPVRRQCPCTVREFSAAPERLFTGFLQAGTLVQSFAQQSMGVCKPQTKATGAPPRTPPDDESGAWRLR
jgi:hypothetical protein